jgi:(1->4)-alpha-D-glucan 1-alpha-D-glucosylmutase
MRIPTSTYRLQFNAQFTFADAAAAVSYLHALGVSDCYASSYLKAVCGSTHGYDVADPTQLNPELGPRADYDRFVEELHRHNMGQVLDVVPNHMGIARTINPWWFDVLENGASSRYASFFDIDWHPLKRELEDKVLLPILGDTYGAVLERQQIQLRYDAGRFVIECGDNRLPVEPMSSAEVLADGLEWLIERLGADHPQLHELQSITGALRRLPPTWDRRPEAMAERAREKEVLRRRLRTLEASSPPVAAFIERNVREFNGRPGDPASFDRLEALLDRQVYRLAFWRVASEEINYRRFFDVNELAAIRTERPEVFDEVHRLVFDLLRAHAVTGLRIDHVDGLYDPSAYLRRWQEWAQAELGEPLYVVVEKILARDEPLPAWPVAGTTGYEFSSAIGNLFVDTRNERALDEIYQRFVQARVSYDDLVYQKKKLIMQVTMASDVNVLGHELNRFSERNRHFRDFTLYSLIHAIREIIACFPVYRTYVSGAEEGVSERDRTYINRAVAAARRRNPAQSGLVFEFVRGLLLKRADYIPDEERAEHMRFIMRFQQMTSPVTAKGIEDTVLYIYNRLVSLNEVGAAPDLFGLTPAQVHGWLGDRRLAWPHALSATATHDTKRGEDVRARLNVLSEIPGAWKQALVRWARLNRRHRETVEGEDAPSRNEEYFLYQTLIGALPFGDVDWPRFQDRISDYMIKALREAKVHSSWIAPNDAHEHAVTGFVRTILEPAPGNVFLDELVVFARRVAQYGIYNSLGQTVVKLAAPGVPDFYQGTELWDLNLVDPDNRRPVDYATRAALLAEVDRLATCDRGQLARDLVVGREDGRIKLHTIASGLRVRRDHPDVFARGEYLPLRVTGARADHVFAFARRTADEEAIAIVPRLVAGLLPDADVPPTGAALWGDTTVHVDGGAPQYHQIFSGEVIPARGGVLTVGDVLRVFPVAVLMSVR